MSDPTREGVAASMYWSRVLTRRERIRLRFTWPYIRQKRLLCPLTTWWLNRG